MFSFGHTGLYLGLMSHMPMAISVFHGQETSRFQET